MRFLLIGATGFIGPHVGRELIARGHDVIAFHRGRTCKSAPTVGADPRVGPCEIIGDRHRLAESADVLRAAAPDVVIDLILSSGGQARDLMSVFRGVARRVVALSSCDVYRACGVLHGSEPGPLEPIPLTEASALRSRGQTYPPERLRAIQQVFPWIDQDYDKIPVEQAILGDERLPGAVLRLPMVYGPGDPLHRNARLVREMDKNAPTIAFEEKAAAWRGPRGFVENVAAAIVLAATSDRAAGRIYNVAEPENLSELDWAREVARIVGWRGTFVAVPAEQAPADAQIPGNLDQHWIVDSSRIRQELGYREPVSRDESIRRTIEYERQA